MKKEILFSFIAAAIVLFIPNVKAAEFQESMGITFPTNIAFLNNSNATSSTNVSYTYILKDNLIDSYYINNAASYKLGTYGFTISMCGLSVVPNSYYSLTMFFEYSNSGLYILSQYSNVSRRLGIGTGLVETGQNRSLNPTQYNTSVMTSNYGGINFQYYTVVFLSNTTGTCVSTSFSSNNNLSMEYAGFYGYKLEYIGNSNLTIDEINNSLNQVQINIQNSIESMKEQQQETNDKLDDIIDADIPDSDKEMPDDSSFQDYTDAEGDLMDKVNEADLDSLDIAIDTNSSNFVWDTITDILNSHPLIMSTIIAILSIGIIKLALGR